jgi:hypothetical protein
LNYTKIAHNPLLGSIQTAISPSSRARDRKYFQHRLQRLMLSSQGSTVGTEKCSAPSQGDLTIIRNVQNLAIRLSYMKTQDIAQIHHASPLQGRGSTTRDNTTTPSIQRHNSLVVAQTTNSACGSLMISKHQQHCFRA